jgi:hypothetical protein
MLDLPLRSIRCVERRVVKFTIVAPYTLLVEFEDATSQTMDSQPVLVHAVRRA